MLHLSPLNSVSRAFCCELPRLQVELVPSGVEAMYARFRSPAAREAAIAHGDFFYDDVRILLGREEISGRAPPREFLCTLIWASPFPAEHFNPGGIRAAFAKVGELLEVDPLNLSSADLSAVRAIVALEDPAKVPTNLWLIHRSVHVRVTEVVIASVWALEHSFIGGAYQRFFAPPPPPPFHHNMRSLPGRRAGPGDGPRSPLTGSDASDGSRYSSHRHGGAVDRMTVTLEPRVLMICAPPPSSDNSPPHSQAAAVPDLAEALSTARAPPSADDLTPAIDEDEGPWETVAMSARGKRKAKKLEKRTLALAGPSRVSSRLALKRAAGHVNAISQASKLRELKDSLKGCSAALQAHVSKNKVFAALTKPLGMKHVSLLRDAALGAAAKVPVGADD
jgi:hypothetical protein